MRRTTENNLVCDRLMLFRLKMFMIMNKKCRWDVVDLIGILFDHWKQKQVCG